jgi:hypothetical protein
MIDVYNLDLKADYSPDQIRELRQAFKEQGFEEKYHNFGRWSFKKGYIVGDNGDYVFRAFITYFRAHQGNYMILEL